MSITSGDEFAGVEIRHLRALVAVGRTSSFSRAAAQLGYAQSAVSQQIAALERAVGVRLVERPGGPRPVSLTEAGRVLNRHAERVLTRLVVARGDLAALTAGEAGTLRVGTFQSVGARILPETVRRFRNEWPGVTVRLVEDQEEDALVEQVLAGELELAFSTMDALDPRIDGVELVRDPWVLLAPPSSPLIGTEPVPLTSLDRLAVVEWSTSSHQSEINAILARQGIETDVVFRSDDNLILQHCVAAGLGHALVGELVVERGSVEWPTVTLRLEEGLPSRRVGVVWTRDRARSRASQAFVETAVLVAAARH